MNRSSTLAQGPRAAGRPGPRTLWRAAARLGALVVAAALGTSCGVEVEVATEPISQDIPEISIGVNAYAEVAVDIPPQALGDIVVESVSATLDVVNTTHATPMKVSLRLSTTGTATPGTPYVFTDQNLPAYFPSALVLLPVTTYAPGTTTPQTISNPGLKTLVNSKRVYLIASNTSTNLGLGDSLPAVIRLQNVVLHATVSKSLASAGGAVDLSGL